MLVGKAPFFMEHGTGKQVIHVNFVHLPRWTGCTSPTQRRWEDYCLFPCSNGEAYWKHQAICGPVPFSKLSKQKVDHHSVEVFSYPVPDAAQR